MVSIDGYNIIRHDRTRTDKRAASGGVCIFLSEQIKYKIIALSPIASVIEFILIDFQIPNESKRFITGVIYNPPGNKDLSSLYNTLDNLADSTAEVYLAGDLNINTLVESPFVEDFKLNVQCAGFNIINNAPTHFNAELHAIMP